MSDPIVIIFLPCTHQRTRLCPKQNRKNRNRCQIGDWALIDLGEAQSQSNSRSHRIYHCRPLLPLNFLFFLFFLQSSFLYVRVKRRFSSPDRGEARVVYVGRKEFSINGGKSAWTGYSFFSLGREYRMTGSSDLT